MGLKLKAGFRRFAAGLATPAQTPGFFGGFQAGLGGALNAGAQEQAKAEAVLKAQIEQQLRQREVAAHEQTAAAAMLHAGHETVPGNVGEINFLMDKLHIPEADALKLVYPGHAGAQPQDWNVPATGPLQEGQQRPGVLPLYLQGASPAEIPMIARAHARSLFKTPGQGRQTPQEKIAGAEQALGRKLTLHEKEVLSGVYRNPLVEATQHQYIDQFGNPFYLDEQGTPTRQRMGPKGPRQPYNVVNEKIFQDQGGGGQGDPLGAHDLYQR